MVEQHGGVIAHAMRESLFDAKTNVCPTPPVFGEQVRPHQHVDREKLSPRAQSGE
jgi:hypothetical protein